MSFDNDWKPRFQSLALSWSHFVGEWSWGYAQDWLWHCLEWHFQEDGGGMKWDLTMLHNLPMRNPGLVLNSINPTNVPCSCTCLPWWGSETYSREVVTFDIFLWDIQLAARWAALNLKNLKIKVWLELGILLIECWFALVLIWGFPKIGVPPNHPFE